MRIIKIVTSAALVMTAFSTSNVAIAQDISFSANVAVTNDYRFRGVSLSNEDIAIQGGIDVSTDMGFYLGTWGSSIEQFNGSELELDIYGGYAGELGNLAFDVGVLAYTYPGGVATDYIEIYGSVGGTIGIADITAGVAYAPTQGNLGDQDNTYAYLDAGMPLGETGFSLAAHAAWEDGFFGDDKIDWLVGVSYSFDIMTLSVNYVDTNVDAAGSDATIMVVLGAEF